MEKVDEQKSILEAETKKRIINKKVGPHLPAPSELKELQYSKNDIISRKRRRIEEMEDKQATLIKDELNKFITEIDNWDTSPYAETFKVCRIDTNTNARNRIIQDFIDNLNKQGYYYSVEFNPSNLYIKVYLYAPILSTFRHNGTLVLTNCQNLKKCINIHSRYY